MKPQHVQLEVTDRDELDESVIMSVRVCLCLSSSHCSPFVLNEAAESVFVHFFFFFAAESVDVHFFFATNTVCTSNLKLLAVFAHVDIDGLSIIIMIRATFSYWGGTGCPA